MCGPTQLSGVQPFDESGFAFRAETEWTSLTVEQDQPWQFSNKIFELIDKRRESVGLADLTRIQGSGDNLELVFRDTIMVLLEEGPAEIRVVNDFRNILRFTIFCENFCTEFPKVLESKDPGMVELVPGKELVISEVRSAGFG
ncbi:uncharacterized protein MELLADRAFT_116330 [Melampsora larici-populina 98AG31]|uniref:Uncharacterized protein n=1 Tax=Melampsora larici-populina (strain 98AG31 / pathotype 3-4-7) TaxID=747676 RepID=F4RK40_MELLP|nr:uncharacterized protein MELLADRAFT_116330 [Melampsora larici-populina 98AG31]EGG07251.1 hypothetical protein MELLADRAFT_116330 [Melampsora larici-populina 98AG31]